MQNESKIAILMPTLVLDAYAKEQPNFFLIFHIFWMTWLYVASAAIE